MLKQLILLLAMFFPFGAFASGMPTIDLSGTITTGGTFQKISLPAQPLGAVEVQNICSVAGNCTATTDICYLYFGTATPTNIASVTSLILSSVTGTYYLRSSGTIPSDAYWITCTSTGDKFYFKVQ